MTKQDKNTTLIALSDAISWNRSLLDSYKNCENSYREFVISIKQNIIRFQELKKKLIK